MNISHLMKPIERFPKRIQLLLYEALAYDADVSEEGEEEQKGKAMTQILAQNRENNKAKLFIVSRNGNPLSKDHILKLLDCSLTLCEYVHDTIATLTPLSSLCSKQVWKGISGGRIDMLPMIEHHLELMDSLGWIVDAHASMRPVFLDLWDAKVALGIKTKILNEHLQRSGVVQYAVYDAVQSIGHSYQEMLQVSIEHFVEGLERMLRQLARADPMFSSKV